MYGRELIICQHNGNTFAQVHGVLGGAVKVLREKAATVREVIQVDDYTVKVVYSDGIAHQLKIEGGKICVFADERV
jgi:hypothetical protein